MSVLVRHIQMVFQRFGFSGARGEAASGFATVRTAALPATTACGRTVAAKDLALLQVLLHLLAVNDDTNLLSRGGRALLPYAPPLAD